AALWIDMGIEAGRITIEKKSRDTYENAAFTKGLVGAGPILLVTSAWHMPRSMLAFTKNGIESIPAPTSYRVDKHSLDFLDLLPGSESLLTSQLALHEYLGILWYNLAR
ncbi:MAG: YdcF family protein, partial [Spirochaetota bacterium]